MTDRLIDILREDIKCNSDNGKGRVIAISYRIANSITTSSNLFVKIVGFPFVKLYRFWFIGIMGIEIPDITKIGPGLQVWHGSALTINPAVIIGRNVLLRHCTTIGNKRAGSGCPTIGDSVDIGAHSILIGDIFIGDNVTIGAGSIVTKSIPSNSIAYGNPLKILPKQTISEHKYKNIAPS